MKKIKTTKRLTFNCETLRTMQLREVTGAGAIVVPSKPQASCFIVCLPTNGCAPTRVHCVVASENC
jgi:hypothetical protein